MNKNRVVCDQNETKYHIKGLQFTPFLVLATRYTQEKAEEWRRWLDGEPGSTSVYTHRIVSGIVRHLTKGQS